MLDFGMLSPIHHFTLPADIDDNRDPSFLPLQKVDQSQAIQDAPPKNLLQGSHAFTVGLLHRKANTEFLSFTGFRKSSGSVTSIVSVAPNESQHRFSALSP
jgi:hypothetical protein